MSFYAQQIANVILGTGFNVILWYDKICMSDSS